MDLLWKTNCLGCERIHRTNQKKNKKNLFYVCNVLIDERVTSAEFVVLLAFSTNDEKQEGLKVEKLIWAMKSK